jgi:23S rRNA (uracil1939-C5)-methyltransferase
VETVKLDKFVPGGQAIGTLANGQKAFVWGGLPGEVVEFTITKRKKSYVEGVALKVLESNPHRVAARDDRYLSTSPWQILEYNYELTQKSELVREAFRQESVPINAEAVITDGKEYFYRNKMEYSLWWDNETSQISLAFYQRGSHRKLPITGSSIERPEVLAEAERIVAELNAIHAEARRYQSLVVRCNQGGEVSSALFENGQPHPKMKPLTDTLLGHEFSYSPNGFFQINLPVYELALQEIKKHINTEKVVDLYAGVGTIGLTVAGDRQLTLAETNKDAFDELQKNCNSGKTACGSSFVARDTVRPVVTGEHLSLAASVVTDGGVLSRRPHAVLAKSEEALGYITNDATIIVDPPRAGLDTKVVNQLLEVNPPTIIYLSCNPTTQARDIKPLLKKYDIKLAQVYNFFPRTPHIEHLVVLNRK